MAAVIAASVSFLTLIGTLAAQYFGRRATSRDTQKTLEEQRKQLDRTLGEQRTRTLNERFATAAEQLGSDKPAVRLAGVYAMAGLADDWEENRQTCVDVLCAYLRMPYEPDPGEDAPEPERLAFQAIREVRHTVIRVITAHLKKDAAVSWQGLNFDFTGVVFDGGDFSGCSVLRRQGSLRARAEFSGGKVDFTGAEFSGGTVYFRRRPVLRRQGRLRRRPVLRRQVFFGRRPVLGGEVIFGGAQFSGGDGPLRRARFSGGTVDFRRPVLRQLGLLQRRPVLRRQGRLPARGRGARFSGGTVDFSDAPDWSTPPYSPGQNTAPRREAPPQKEDQSEA